MKTYFSQVTLALLTLAMPAVSASPPSETTAKHASDSAPKAGREITYANGPLSFEAIGSQAGPGSRFVSRGNGFNISLTPTETTLVLRNQASPREPQLGPITLRMKFVGANVNAKATAIDPLPGLANYFIGNDPRHWRTKVPTFAKVKCQDVYPGVDLVYYGNGRQLEFDFIVAPGADPRQITLGFAGMDKMEVAANGDLVLRVGDQELRQHKPVIYQTVNGARKEISGGFKLNDKLEARFDLAAYDQSSPLVIDPVLTYSTYLGGSSTDVAGDIAVDAAGNFYVVGATMSTDFPVTAALQPTNSLHSVPGLPGTDVFVTKFRPDGSLVYSTYLGGPDFFSDEGDGIAIDDAGNAYITGFAGSRQFPTTPGAFQTAAAGGAGDAFV
ncbi:MAG TPA: SBBP repeat-containing protein, partial [Verrucomicrobiae bacterium]|nr:SBBP repeat-containing protein [Verrucomicrobiae bacterium]